MLLDFASWGEGKKVEGISKESRVLGKEEKEERGYMI